MSRKPLILVMLLAGVVVAGTATALYARSRFGLRDWEPPQVATVCPAAPGGSPPGTPAITPRNDCTPSFTEQDVRDYVSQLHGLFKIGFVGQPTIMHIWFITSDDAAKLTDEAPSNLGPRVVCYVELSGTFTIDYPPGTSPRPGAESPHHAFIIFDAHSGNWLEAGARA